MKRFMNKMNEKKGFTLAELLIVVAIIAVLVAVAIPVFTTQLEKSREATDVANLRSAYAEAVSTYLADGTTTATSATYKVQQKTSGWQNTNVASGLPAELSTAATSLSTTTSGNFAVTVTVDDTGKITATLGSGSGS